MKIPILYKVELFIRKLRNNAKSKLINKFCDLKRYDLIFSLGEACFCASMLNKFGLRKLSCPFDWLYGDDFESLIDILCNEFEGWLNIEDLEFRIQRLEPEPGDVYHNKKTGITFNHDFKINTPLEKSFPIAKEKYDRRIKRLLNILSQEKDVLIVYMEYPDSTTTIVEDAKLVDVVNRLNAKFKANISLLYVEHDDKMQDFEHHYKEINSNTTKITLFNGDRSPGAQDPGNFNNVKIILPKIIGLKDN